jgi:hypothetical protein
MRQLVILGCSKRKLPHAAKARDLYQGALFKAGMAYAGRIGADVAILSAKHGLLHPDDIIAPYDEPLTMAKAYEYAQQESVRAELKDLTSGYDRIVVIAGKPYRFLLNEWWDNRFHSGIMGGIGTSLHLLAGMG